MKLAKGTKGVCSYITSETVCAQCCSDCTTENCEARCANDRTMCGGFIPMGTQSFSTECLLTDQEIADLYNSGSTNTEIAKLAGVAKTYINSRIHQMRKQGVKIISKKKQAIPWETLDQDIIALCKRGIAHRKIAEHCNVSINSIKKRIGYLKEKGAL